MVRQMVKGRQMSKKLIKMEKSDLKIGRVKINVKKQNGQRKAQKSQESNIDENGYQET